MSFAPLENSKVLDFSWNVAGPTATKVLACLGAEVLKVEWPTRPDPGRSFAFSPVQEGVFDSGGFFADLNIGKRSVTLDPNTDTGKDLVERLIATCDVLVESYSPRVMAKWGWTPARVRELNPRIVYLSVSGFGHTGPHGNYVSYGPTAQAASGVTHASGEPGRPPAGWGYSFLDVMTGYQAAYATVAAIHKQRLTGAGDRIDLSQVETGAAMLGPMLVDVAARGRDGQRTAGFPPGNRTAWPGADADGYRYERGAPYNLYRTSDEGTDGFCAISVMTDAQWDSLRECMGSPDWADAPEYATVDGRLANQEALDRHVGSWTRKFGKYDLMDRLQRNGVPCGAMQSGRDRLESDPSLRSRGVFQELEHAVVGRKRFESFPLQVDGRPLRLPPRWPYLGTDTEDVLRETLGLSTEEINRLRESGDLWPSGLARPAYEAVAS